MPHDAPRPAEALVRVLQRLHEIVPGGRHRGRGDTLDQRAILAEQLVDGRGDQLGLEIGKARQAGEVEERVHASVMSF
jgi:hypothetical protein